MDERADQVRTGPCAFRAKSSARAESAGTRHRATGSSAQGAINKILKGVSAAEASASTNTVVRVGRARGGAPATPVMEEHQMTAHESSPSNRGASSTRRAKQRGQSEPASSGGTEAPAHATPPRGDAATLEITVEIIKPDAARAAAMRAALVSLICAVVRARMGGNPTAGAA